MKPLMLVALSLLAVGCSKSGDLSCSKTNSLRKSTDAPSRVQAGATTPTTFTRYTIQKGAHTCDQSRVKSVSGTVMNFVARFDSSAIYPAVITDYNHAYDVNKLYGFSEGLNNQYNSARIGWRWLNGSLELFAYVYVKGNLLRDPISYNPPFIRKVALNTDINCSIAISGNTYLFTVDGVVVKTPRGSSTSRFSGYQ